MLGKGEKFLYLLAGTGLGAVVGLVCAPKSGKQLRNDLSSQTQRSIDAVSHKIGDGGRYVREKGSAAVKSWVDAGKSFAEAGIDRLTESIEAGKEEYRQERDRRSM